MIRLIIFLAVAFLSSPALAQNPTCPTRLPGDNTNACASTAFVQHSLFSPPDNLIHNGYMEVSQINGTTAVPCNGAGGSPPQTVDRWHMDCNGTMVTQWQQVTDAPIGFSNSIKVTVTTAETPLGAGDVTSFFQSFEGQTMNGLAWGTAAAQNLSCGWWVKSFRTGQHGGAVKNYNGTRAWTFAYTINASLTWEYKTTTIVGDTSPVWPSQPGQTWGYLLLNIAPGANFQYPPGVWTVPTIQAANATGSVNNVQTLSDTTQYTGVTCWAGNAAPNAAQSLVVRRAYSTELWIAQRYARRIYYPAITGAMATTTVCGRMRQLLNPPMMITPTTVRMNGNIPIVIGAAVDTLASITGISNTTSTAIDIIGTISGAPQSIAMPCGTISDGTLNSSLDLFAEPP